MQYGKDFTVEFLPKRSHGHGQTVKPTLTKKNVMEPTKTFKHSLEMRNYWAECKQRSRAKQKPQPTGDNPD